MTLKYFTQSVESKNHSRQRLPLSAIFTQKQDDRKKSTEVYRKKIWERKVQGKQINSRS